MSSFLFRSLIAAAVAAAITAPTTAQRWTAADVDATLDLREDVPGAEALFAELQARGVQVRGLPFVDARRLDEVADVVRARFGTAAEDLRLVRYLKWPAGTDVGNAITALAARPEVERIVRWQQPSSPGDFPPTTAPSLGPIGLLNAGWAPRAWSNGYRAAGAPAAPGGHGVGSLAAHATPRPNGELGATRRIGVIELGFDTLPAVFPASQFAPFHEDLQNANITVVFPSGSSVPATQIEANHGMATLGVLVADKDQANGIGGPGATGIAAASPITLIQQQTTAAASIATALGLTTQPNPAPLTAGDVLLVELQLGIGAGALPISSNPGDFAAVQAAVALGIHVIEPAGNGGVSVDAFGDNGSIMVGAIDPATGLASVFGSGGSNFGQRVNACSWGRQVGTLGATNNPGGVIPGQGQPLTLPVFEQYTNNYDGTSSASAVIAGVVAALLDAHGNARTALGPLASEPTPAQVRNLFRDAAGPIPTVPIGVFPDAGDLLGRLQPVQYGTGVSALAPTIPPVMTNLVATGGAAPLLADTPSTARIGTAFQATVRGVPLYTGYLNAIVVSGLPAATPTTFGSLLGTLYVDPASILFQSPALLPATYMPGCASSPGLCGQFVTPIAIPNLIGLAGLPFYVQGFTVDYSQPTPTWAMVTNGLAVVITS